MLKLRHRTNDEVFLDGNDVEVEIHLVEQTPVDAVVEIMPGDLDVTISMAGKHGRRQLKPLEGVIQTSLRTNDHLYFGSDVSIRVLSHSEINTTFSYRVPNEVRIETNRESRRI